MDGLVTAFTRPQRLSWWVTGDCHMHPPCQYDLDTLLPTSFPAPAAWRRIGPLERSAFLRGHRLKAEAEVT